MSEELIKEVVVKLNCYSYAFHFLLLPLYLLSNLFIPFLLLTPNPLSWQFSHPIPCTHLHTCPTFPHHLC